MSNIFTAGESCAKKKKRWKDFLIPPKQKNANLFSRMFRQEAEFVASQITNYEYMNSIRKYNLGHLSMKDFTVMPTYKMIIINNSTKAYTSIDFSRLTNPKCWKQRLIFIYFLMTSPSNVQGVFLDVFPRGRLDYEGITIHNAEQ